VNSPLMTISGIFHSQWKNPGPQGLNAIKLYICAIKVLKDKLGRFLSRKI
jgi:hypothetical protein